MLSIEDCLELLDVINWDPPLGPEGEHGEPLHISNTWDRRFISDVSYHTRAGKPISTAQGEITCKLIARYRPQLIAYGVSPSEIDEIARTPRYRIPAYQSSAMPREVRWAGDSKLIFRFKYNPIVGEDVKKLRGPEHLDRSRPMFSGDPYKVWIVCVSPGNIDRVMEVIRRHCFKFDDTVANFLMEATNSKGAQSSADVEGEFIQVQVRDDDFLNAWLNDLKWLQ